MIKNPIATKLIELNYDMEATAEAMGITEGEVRRAAGPYVMAEEERFRSKVVAEMLLGELTIQGMSEKYGVSQVTLRKWKQQRMNFMGAKSVIYIEEQQQMIEDLSTLVTQQQSQMTLMESQLTHMATQLSSMASTIDSLTTQLALLTGTPSDSTSDTYVFLSQDIRELSEGDRRALLGTIKESHPELLEQYRMALNTLI